MKALKRCAALGLFSCVGSLTGGQPAVVPNAPPDAVAPTVVVGRSLRRLNADQIRASLVTLTGFAYTGQAVVRDPDSPTGYSQKEDADLLEFSAAALGRPDYDFTVRENLTPGVSFSKFVEDAARSVCGKLAKAEVADRLPLAPARLLITASADDTLENNEAKIRENLVIVVHRFWGLLLSTDHEDISALVSVFRSAADAPQWKDSSDHVRQKGASEDGWRSVCIALVNDPQFFVY